MSVLFPPCSFFFFFFFKGCGYNEASSFVSLLTDNDEASVSKRGQDPATQSSSPFLEDPWGFLLPPTGTAVHTGKTTSLAALSHFTGVETKVRRLREGQWFGRDLTVPLEAASGYTAPPTPCFSRSGCSDAMSEWMKGIIMKGSMMF